MFKEDGSEIRNPKRYVASIEKNGYNHPLFTKDGEEIRDPVAYLAKLDLGPDEKAKPKKKAQPKEQAKQGGKRRKPEAEQPQGAGIMFKADGTAIKNPEAYVASIERNGYTQPLFTARGTEIRDPVGFLASQSMPGAGGPRDEPPQKQRRMAGQKGVPGRAALQDSGMYTADGKIIKNPEGYVAAIERNGYTKPLFTALGEEIRNPSAYLAKNMQAEAALAPGQWVMIGDSKDAGKQGPQGLFKANGVQIKNPGAYVANIEKNGYTEPLFTADGKEIRNPVAYVAKMQSNETGKPGAYASMQPEVPEVQMFKADGTQIKNPEGYVASIERNGYNHPLFTVDGKEIRNPSKYLEIGLRGGVATVPKPAQKRGAAKGSSKGAKKNFEPKKAVKDSRQAGEERPEGLYKEDGRRIKNPAAYVANFEKNGQTQTLLNARGQVVKNPAAYVAKMLENAEKRPMLPKSTDGKFSYYGKPGSGTLAQRLRTALTSGMRARAAQAGKQR